MTHSESWVAHAVLYLERFGFSVIPMTTDKVPAVPWKGFQERKASIQEILDWPKDNLAIVTGSISGIVVVDCDTKEDAVWFWKNRSESPAVVKTRRGFHFYFQHPGEPIKNGIKIEGHYDVKGDGGYVLAPPSTHSEGCYKWVKDKNLTAVKDLPYFKPSWRPETVSETSYDKIIKDGAAYIAKIVAVEGQGGHDTTYRAAACLKTAGLSEAEAFVALMEWNKTNADPPWTDRELLHKVKSVYSK
jgi:hypothetical protein